MADNDDWEDEELLLVTGRSSKAPSKKRQRKASDSDDDYAADEDDRPAAKVAAKPAAAKRRAAAPAARESDDGDSDDGMDEEERRKLASMNELEREMYLFEREEILQRQRERQQILNQRREAEQVEVRASTRRPRAPTGTDSAIGRIAAAHAQREAREKKKQQREEEEKAERQAARRGRKRADEDEELEAAEASEEEAQQQQQQEAEAEEEDDELRELLAGEDDEDELTARGAGALGARAEAFDEGASYEELEDRATLDEVRSVTLARSDLERWHNEPFFEEDARGCLVRIVNQAERARTGQPSYLLARVADVVARNSYAFPAGAKASRTRKWLHLDDLSGSGVFRHQMSMVSNSEVTQAEYDKAVAKAERGGHKFVTRGDVQAARERLAHARNFKYNPELVKQLLEKKRAAGKVSGSVAQHRARLTHELNLARQEGKPEEEVQRIQDELDRLEQQEAARGAELQSLMQEALAEKDSAKLQSIMAKLPPDMALSVVNARNRDKNNFKVIQAPVARAGGGDGGGAMSLFARRHTQSKVYWATGGGKAKAGGAADEQQQPQQQQEQGGAGGGLQRQASGVADVSALKGSLKRLEPAELIKVLDLSIDLGALPSRDVAVALLPRRLLGTRWLQSVERRQRDTVAGRSLLTLDDWKRKMAYQQMV